MPAASTVTLSGNATRDPELRFTPAGKATCSLGVAVNHRWRDNNNEWQESVSFFDVVCWEGLAENVASTIAKGTRVVVTGRLVQRSWEKDDEKRSKVEVLADDVAPSLRWATADVRRTERRQPAAASAPATGAAGYDEEPF